MADAVSLTNVSLSMPPWREVANVLLLQGGINSFLVTLGTTLLGMSAGVVGTFALLRKRALMGDALAHSALPGLCVAFLIATYAVREFNLDPKLARNVLFLLAGAAISGVLGVMTVQLLVRLTRLTEDTAIGAVLSVFFGTGIVLLSYIQSLDSSSAAGLHHFIYGQAAAMERRDALIILCGACLVLMVIGMLLKEFRLVCFDPEYAAVQGWPITAIDMLLMSLVVLVTVIGLHSVGILLVVALLIIPAAAARFWTERLTRMTLISALIGAGSGYVGASLSALFPRLPAGSVIVLAAGALFVFSFLFAPARGVISGVLRRLRFQLTIVTEHVLRGAYERLERIQATDMQQAIDLASFKYFRGWRPAALRLFIGLLQLKGLVKFSQKQRLIQLSPLGVQEAIRVTRNHRLWEEYLVHFSHVSRSHVDYSADRVEHVLSDELVRHLEEELSQKGKLPIDRTTPKSVHPLS